MAQLAATVITADEDFKRQVSRLLRAGGVPVGIVEARAADSAPPDVYVVDIRGDLSSGMAAIERLRASQPRRWKNRFMARSGGPPRAVKPPTPARGSRASRTRFWGRKGARAPPPSR
jgi:hypothetical protein